MSATVQPSETIDAVYGRGTVRAPGVTGVSLIEGEKVLLIVEPVGSPQSGVDLLMHLYDGLSEEEIDEIEKVILDRRDFFSGRLRA